MLAFTSLLAGLVFGIGLMVSGMANPAKEVGFLDLFGRWDPSLALVMDEAKALVFVAAMLAGMGLFDLAEWKKQQSPALRTR